MLPAPSRRDAWEAEGAPVVILVPDHLGLDERAEFYAAPLLEGGIAVLLLDLPPSPDLDKWSRLLPREPRRPNAAEELLPALFGMLRMLDSERSSGQPSRRRAVGLLGFGPGGEAVVLAAHEAVASRFLPGPGAPRFGAHAVLYPTCNGPMLSGLRHASALTTRAPVLVIIPYEGGPGELPAGCGLLFDHTNPHEPDPFTVRPYDSLGYGFDLWPAAAAVAVLRHPSGLGGLDPMRFDVLRAELARRDVASFLAAALTGPHSP